MEPSLESISESGPGFIWEATKGERKVFLTASLERGISELPPSLTTIAEQVKRIYFETHPDLVNKKWVNIWACSLIMNKVKKTPKLTDDEKNEILDRIFAAAEDVFESNIEGNYGEKLKKHFKRGKFSPAVVAQLVLLHLLNQTVPQEQGLQSGLSCQCKHLGKRIHHLYTRKYYRHHCAKEDLSFIRRFEASLELKQLKNTFQTAREYYQNLLKSYQEGNLEHAQKAVQDVNPGETWRSKKIIQRYVKLATKIERISKQPALIVLDIKGFTGDHNLLEIMYERGWEINPVSA